MPDVLLFVSEAERRDAERLSPLWNALVRGDARAARDLDPGDAAVLDRLRALARPPRPRQAFVDQLKEQLMDTSYPIAAGGAAHPEPPFSIVQPLPRASVGRRRRFWDESRRGLGAVATIALLIVSLVGSYLAISWSDPGGGRQSNRAGQVAGATPAASPAACIENCPDYAPTSPFVRLMGHGFINKGDYSDADLAAAEVQLQAWAVDPGSTIQLPADATGGVHGAVVDVVLDGVYVVTIDAPAVISRNNDPVRRFIEYTPAGTTVELGRGDTISYPAGHARTVVNPLSTIKLLFKSAVFYDGDVSLTRPPEPLPDGVRLREDGNGTLPMTLAEYPNFEVSVSLEYIQVAEGTELPTERHEERRIIGPVDPQAGPAGTEGYVLWVAPVRA